MTVVAHHAPLVQLLGVPTSAGAYAPGQERAPEALRAAGLVTAIEAKGLRVQDLGDTPGFRWCPDAAHPHAMHAEVVADTMLAVAGRLRTESGNADLTLVLGGDCTVELGVVAGLRRPRERLGLVYFDFDADLHTPDTTHDGALDWMVLGHLLDLPGACPPIRDALGVRLQPEQVLLFGTGNIKPAEQFHIDALALRCISAVEVAADPTASAHAAIDWIQKGGFDRVLIHLDADVLDYAQFPIAENTRRFQGLSIDQTMRALGILMIEDAVDTLTVCEINPDHCPDKTTLVAFAQALAVAITCKP